MKRFFSWSSLAALLVLGFILPWEMEQAWLHPGPLEFTNLELWLAIVLILAVLRWIFEGRPSLRLPRSWIWLGVFFLVFLLASSIFAPDHRENALKAALRTISGITLMLSMTVIVRTRRELSLMALSLGAGAVVAASIGLGEVATNSPFGWLDALRDSVTVTGPYLRLSGPFDYANQAAMYMEAVIPLLAGLCLVAAGKRQWVVAISAAVGVCILVQAALATYSRSALVLVSSYGLLLAVSALWLRRKKPPHMWLIPLLLGAAVLIITLANILVDPVWRMRFSSEGDIGWYRAQIMVPETLRVNAGRSVVVPVSVQNDSAFTLQSSGATPIYLAARWVHPESQSQIANQHRWSIPGAIEPGDGFSMEVPLHPLTVAGEFELVWDLVQEEVTWFGAKTGVETATSVTITGSEPLFDETGSSALSAGDLIEEWQIPAPIPGRFTLWRTAWTLWRGSMLLGIGLDNYRLLYGQALDYELWNQTIHTNNWYIETIVSLGLLGAIPFLAWLVLLVIDLVRRSRKGGIWCVALAASLLAYFVHGLLDYFLLFNATALLFWILVGLWAAMNYRFESDVRTGE